MNEWKVLFGLTDRVTDRAGRFVLKMDGDGEAEIQGEVLLGDSQLHLHQEDSVVVGEDLVYSHCDLYL